MKWLRCWIGAVLDKNAAIIAALLPRYQRQADADPILIAYASAVVHEKSGQLKAAIAIYRQILADYPDLTPIRFELAKVLFDDQQNTAATEQFNKVKSAHPPDFVVELADAFLAALRQRGRSDVDFSLNYLNDPNVNNANDEPYITDTPFMKSERMRPESAQGLGYRLNLKKDVNVHANHYLQLANELSGKHYWTNTEYNDLINRSTLGYVYQDDKNTLALLPFYEVRRYGNQRHKESAGVRGEFSHWFSSNHQLSVAGEYANNHYRDYPDLEGDSHLLSLTHIWLINPRRFMIFGLDASRDNAKACHHTYHYQALRLGVGQEWQWGISTRLNASIAKRTYQSDAIIGNIIPLDITRSDDEYALSLSLWKRDWHLWGITLKLSYQYKQVDSNIPSMYSTKKSQLFFSFEKSF